MRKLSARDTQLQGHRDPGEAIGPARAFNWENRTVADTEIRGRVVRAVLWSDSILCLGLDTGRFLSVAAGEGRVECSLLDHAGGSVADTEEIIALELNGKQIEWNRGRVARSYIGKELYRLWFNPEGLYIYAKNMPILACHAIQSCLDGTPNLLDGKRLTPQYVLPR